MPGGAAIRRFDLLVQRGIYGSTKALNALSDVIHRGPRRILLSLSALLLAGVLGIGVYATIAGGGHPIGFLESSNLYRLITGGGYLPREIGADTDVGLVLLRNSSTSDRVSSFYSDLTGSSEISRAILKAADKYNVPLSLAFALAWKESNFLPSAVNFNGGSTDRGLYQLNSLSFPSLHEKDFFDPQVNADGGLRYLSQCLNQGGNEIAGLAMYNAGMSRVLQDGTPLVTLDYISTILKYQNDVNAQFEAVMLKSGRSAGLLASIAPVATSSPD